MTDANNETAAESEHGVGTRANNTFGSITHRRRVINNMKKFWKSPIDQSQQSSSDSSDPQTPVQSAFSKKLSLSLTPNPATKHSAIKSPQFSPCFTGKSSRRSSFASNSPGNKSNISSEFTDAEESEAEDTSSNIMCLQLLPTESKRNLLTNWECIPPPKSPTPPTSSSDSKKEKKMKKRRPPTRSVAGTTKREEKRVPTKVSKKTTASLPPPKSPLRVTIRRKCNKRPKDLKKSKKAAATKHNHNSNNNSYVTSSPMKPTSSIIINDSKSKNKKSTESKSASPKPKSNSKSNSDNAVTKEIEDKYDDETGVLRRTTTIRTKRPDGSIATRKHKERIAPDSPKYTPKNNSKPKVLRKGTRPGSVGIRFRVRFRFR
jgi:hypothetical protein